ncbi:MAG: aspartyl/asparaginyl beta-hydroxylase domain-containing protein [Steroidobacteraceae bacterium]
MDIDLDLLPVIDKHRLIGACVRLPTRVDGVRLAAEVNALPQDVWGCRSGRGGVHDRADAIFLRGYAPAEGRKPLEDRPPLALLPTVRQLISQMIPAPPMRCVLARLAPGANIPCHADAGRYLDRTIRLHVAVITNPRVVMMVEGKRYHMLPGEVWALNNSGTHGVLNDDPVHARTHLICDFLPAPELIQLIAAGDPDLGVEDPEVMRRFQELYLAANAAAADPR